MKLSTREAPQSDTVRTGTATLARKPAASPRTTGSTTIGSTTAGPVTTGPVTTGTAGGNAAIHRLVSGRTAARHADLGLLAAGGSRALQRLGARPKLTVSQPHDPAERQADAMATRITSGAPAPALTVAPTPIVRRQPSTPDSATDVPPAVEGALRSPGAGSPLPAAVIERLEPHLGVDLSVVRVHADEQAQEAAARIEARAFTTGTHIFLGAGESPGDVALMAHEATHVAQQAGASALPAVPAPSVGAVHRADDGLLPDFILDAVKDLARAMPGYAMLTVVAGYDPIANRTVARTPENLVRGVIGLAPFGAIVADKIIELGVIQHAFQLVDAGLAAHNLTLARIQGELDQVWDQLSLTKGIDGNAAVIRGHVDKLYADALGFARGIIDSVVQLIRDAAVGLAEKYLVGTPSWELAKKVLHQDPLRGTPVAATTVEILADFLKLIGKQDALAQMQERGTLQKTADWLDTQIGRFLGIINDLGALFKAGWEAIQPQNIASLPDNLSKLAHDAIALVGRIAAFGGEIIVTVLKLVKEALLGWLSQHAHELKGFRLLTVILGQNPFTGQAVARTAENLIGGFIALLPNGEAMYTKLSESGVIADAGAQIEGAMARLGISLDMITQTFKAIWDTLSLEDLLNPVGAFIRVLDKFGEPLARIVAFAGEVLKVVISLVLKLMNLPTDLMTSIINHAMQAIEDIKKDPVAFLTNMLQALKTGFLSFLDKIVGYLLSGLADWLFRGLGALGITKPPDFSLKSILELVLQVVGITAESMWKKLGKHIGEENVDKIRKGIAMAGEAWQFIKDVQEGGVAAVWKYVEDKLGNLWDTLLNMAKDWIVEKIIDRVTAKLISMLDPTGIMAVVNSMIAFYNAVESAIEYIREILMIVNDYVTTLAAVAAGNISAGAAKVEKGLANAVPVAIGFLANQVGLGNVPEKVVEIINGLRTIVDEALDWLFEQAMKLGKAALSALGVGGPSAGEDTEKSAAVKTKATTMLQERTKQPFKTLPELQAATGAVLEALRPEGLKDVIVRPDPKLPGHYLIAVSASKEKEADDAYVGEKAPLDEELKKKVVAVLKLLHPYKNEAQIEAAIAEMSPADADIADAVRVARDAVVDPDAIAHAVAEVARRAAEPSGVPFTITLKTQVYKGESAETTLELDPRNASERFLAALLQMSKEAQAAEQDVNITKNPHVVVLVAGKKEKNFNATEFFKDIVAKGYRFLDVAVLSAQQEAFTHGAATHLIQDLVVDAAFKKKGIAMGSGTFRTKINNSIWVNVFDAMDTDAASGRNDLLNDPNQLYPKLRSVIGDLDIALTRISDVWRNYQAKAQTKGKYFPPTE